MALYKEIELENGTVASYHRIKYVMLDKNNKVDVLVYSYASKAIRDKEAEIYDEEEIVKDETYLLMSNIFKLEDEYQLISYSDAYNGLKKMEFFNDSSDI